jgi:hypothetical protein
MIGLGTSTDTLSDKSSYLPILVLNSNSANLKKIECVPGIEVPLQLLAIEEIMKCECIDICKHKFNNPKHNSFECHIDHKNFAHLYVTTDNPKEFIQHYIIAFIEAKNIGYYNELLNILCKTVKQLKIAHNRIHFYIYYYGKRPVINLSLPDINRTITKELRSALDIYEKSFCHIHTSENNSENFTINSSNPYQFNYS